ncbi:MULTISPECIES: hypothetical protein [Streptosporangium]|uniref:Uncharacterized protein n=1 Tax=Streptosporangium brasiliense TaxID=47480 RepID=A0ABT9RNV4_9ACTN|nr:hypothetical protein [Streptosporangium brasiliense]MDP9870394.1 hypothetical protein [Streptosporangium brasiliense]
MRTCLTPDQLASLAAQGFAESQRSRFVDPDAVAKSKRILCERGEEWAASVLMRDLSRRSLLLPHLPYLENGELETLILADRAEWDQLAALAQA